MAASPTANPPAIRVSSRFMEETIPPPEKSRTLPEGCGRRQYSSHWVEASGTLPAWGQEVITSLPKKAGKQRHANTHRKFGSITGGRSVTCGNGCTPNRRSSMKFRVTDRTRHLGALLKHHHLSPRPRRAPSPTPQAVWLARRAPSRLSRRRADQRRGAAEGDRRHDSRSGEAGLGIRSSVGGEGGSHGRSLRARHEPQSGRCGCVMQIIRR